MSRRIILIDLYWTRDKDPRIPLGHASLRAALARWSDADVRSLIVAANGPEADPKAIADRVTAELPADHREVDVAVGVYVWAEELVAQLLVALRHRGFRGRIILGGPQISYAPSGIAERYPQADVFIRGYAERALAALAGDPGRPRIPGVVYTGGFDTAEVAKVELEELPSPWLEGVLPLAPRQFVRWETQRGCPYRCSFCQHRQAGARLDRASLDEDRVMAEIDLFCDRGVGDIAVLDPVFNAGDDREHPRSQQLLERFIERGYVGRLSLQCRPERIDARFLRTCAQLNCTLEFGLQTVVPSEWGPIQRGNKLERVEETLAGCQELGIEHEVSLIFGLPNQTLASFERSLQWCLERRVPVIRAFPLLLLRGTALERERERWGLVTDGSAMAMVQRSNSFDETDWRRMALLSDALRRSEGRHPTSVAGLWRLVAEAPELARWTPSPTV